MPKSRSILLSSVNKGFSFIFRSISSHASSLDLQTPHIRQETLVSRSSVKTYTCSIFHLFHSVCRLCFSAFLTLTLLHILLSFVFKKIISCALQKVNEKRTFVLFPLVPAPPHKPYTPLPDDTQTSLPAPQTIDSGHPS